jgi:hypothetical protein
MRECASYDAVLVSNAVARDGEPLIRLRPERVLHWGGAESALAGG